MKNMQINLDLKREHEKRIVEEMIILYCRKKHKTKHLCNECKELLDYAKIRSDKCPFMENKTFCSNCKLHCYKSAMQKKIKEVMRFSGPRMLIYHPILAIKHLIETKKEQKRRK